MCGFTDATSKAGCASKAPAKMIPIPALVNIRKVYSSKGNCQFSLYPIRPKLNHVQTKWLSGEIAFFVNKASPVIWLAAMATVFRLSGPITLSPLIVFALLALAYLIWFSTRLQRVGYTGRELIVSNYSREERIPFDQVVAVEPVWWYRRRMVRIRLRPDNSFGPVVYYIPKWAAFKCLWVAPEKELQALIGKR